MSKAFGETKGKASSGVESYEYKNGENSVRLVGGILARYVYWLKGTNDKNIPVECLAFDREKERFSNKEVDHVKSRHPGKTCSWSYVMLCIDPKDNKVKPINLKKKLFQQITDAAEDLGDPTDPVTGWTVNFKKAKTGPLPYNIEYTLNVLRCKPQPLTEAEIEAVAASDTIDMIYKRPTADEVLALLDRMEGPGDDSAEEQSEASKEAIKDL